MPSWSHRVLSRVAAVVVAAAAPLGGCGDSGALVDATATESGGSEAASASSTAGTTGASDATSDTSGSTTGASTTGVTSGTGTTSSTASTGASTATSDGTSTTDTSTGGDEPLQADAGADRYALVDELVVLDGAGSTGATEYRWFFGDGRGWDEFRPTPRAELTYPAPGRYQAVLTVRDATGVQRSDRVTITVTRPATHTPSRSTSVVRLPGTPPAIEDVAVVSPDSDELTLVRRTSADAGDPDAATTFEVRTRIPTCAEPRTVAAIGDRIAVACHRGDAVRIVGRDGADPVDVPMPRGSRPFGVIAHDGALWVTLQGLGELARIDGATTPTPAVGLRLAAIPDARGLATTPDGRLLVSRWRSPADGGELAWIEPSTGDVAPIVLAVDTVFSSDTRSAGVPSYLDTLAVAPTGELALVPGLHANVVEGAFIGAQDLRFETTLRASMSWIDLATGNERVAERSLFDNKGLTAAATFNAAGDWAFVAFRGSRTVRRIDVFSGADSGSIQGVGLALQGLELAADDRFLYVDAYLSRELVVYDVRDLSVEPAAAARLTIPSAEPLTPELLAGKRLFNDAADPRLGRDSYLACAHCHLDAEPDGHTWDFTGRGEGLRNTIDLLGRGGAAPLHWSANFDEVQDFEHDIRGPQQGLGLMSDADFASGTVGQTLGEPKAGRSADLDALAAYVVSLTTHLRSPYRAADGSFTAQALAGRAVFVAAGCETCHAGPQLTDSGFEAPGQPRLHDVGTLGPGSGQRLGGPLLGLDTPSLHGLWATAPYLHDGSAATLRDVLTTRNPADRHGVTSTLTPDDLAALEAYLLQLEGPP